MTETKLANLACPICGKNKGQVIVKGENIEDIANKTIGYMETPCSDCHYLLNKGKVIVGIDLSKTTDKLNPYRTGHIFVIDEKVEEIPHKVCFMDIKDMKSFGLIKEEDNVKTENIQMEENIQE